MRRRGFITLLVGAAAWPLTGHAQQPDRVRRVGVLNAFPENDPVNRASVAAFAGALEQLGWVEGENIRIDYRFAAGDPALFKTYAAELVGLSPDAILASNAPAVAALRQQTRTIPIVFVRVADPVGQGFVQSLARPGGNITGFSVYDRPDDGKMGATVERGCTLCHPGRRHIQPGHRALRRIAQPWDRGRRPVSRDDGDICSGAERSWDRGRHRRPGARAGRRRDRFAGQFYTSHRDVIIAAASRHGLPVMGATDVFPRAGGLISYGFDLVAQYPQGASYIDRILKGASPADLPVQQPTKFSLVINLKTAKAFGLTVPELLLALADEVIE